MHQLTLKRLFALGSLLLGVSFLGSGCASTRPLPKTYLASKHDLATTVVKIPDKPQMMDSGGGGLIGVLVTQTSRKPVMKEMLDGVQGETMKGLIQQEVVRVFQEKFNVVDTRDDLNLDIQIIGYGFFVPTTVLGIKSGAYQFRIWGHVEIRDAKLKKKKVAYANAIVDAPLGSKPAREVVPEAITQCVQKFAASIYASLVEGKSK